MRYPALIVGACVLAIGLAALCGPSTPVPALQAALDSADVNPDQVDRAIARAESRLPVRPYARAQVRWADSVPAVTDVAILYLHGFSGTWHDGSPAIERIASQVRANLLLARLHGHGLDVSEPLLDFSADSVYTSAVQALSMARTIGRSVVVIGTSTGATLGMLLAARFPEVVAGVVNWSPNVRLAHPLSFLSNGPWGLELTKIILGGDYRDVPTTDTARNMYWYMKYRAEAIPRLQALLEASMTEETFGAIKQPVLTMCWYRDETTQDSLVSVPAMRMMHSQLGSTRKHFVTLDAGNHEIGYGRESRVVDDVVRRTVAWIGRYGSATTRANY